MTLKGVDYSADSIRFASFVRDSLSAQEDLEEQVRADYAKIQFEEQDAYKLQDEGVYDVIYDKGTFDVTYLNHEIDNKAYARAIHHRMSKTNPHAVFIITSGNCVQEELNTIFCSEGLFELKKALPESRKFTFGGVTG